MKLIFRYSFTDQNGVVHRAKPGHPFPILVNEDKDSAEAESQQVISRLDLVQKIFQSGYIIRAVTSAARIYFHYTY